jgi:hypothetical protein
MIYGGEKIGMAESILPSAHTIVLRTTGSQLPAYTARRPPGSHGRSIKPNACSIIARRWPAYIARFMPVLRQYTIFLLKMLL